MAATFDIEATYLLTNGYAGPSKQLATTFGAGAVMNVASNDTDSQWFFTNSPQAGYYYLHTKAKGIDTTLDVINDNNTDSTKVYFATTGYYSGQFWRFDPWGDGSYRISNSFTGLDKHLDVYADNLRPYLAAGDRSGQHWTVNTYTPTTSTTSSVSTSKSSPTTSSTGAVSSAAASNSTPASTTRSDHALAPGAIGGIAAGAVILLAILIAAFAFAIAAARKRRRRRQQIAGLGQHTGHGSGYHDRPYASELGAAPAEKSAGVQYSSSELQGSYHPVEISPRYDPVELGSERH